MVGYLVLAAAACMARGGAEPAPLGEPFSLRVGETALVAETGVTITFATVERDSRCPEGVQCIRAGEAVVLFTFTASASDEATTLRFEVPPGGSAALTLAEHGVNMSVDRLEPPARDGERIDQEAYVATVTVTVTAEVER